MNVLSVVHKAAEIHTTIADESLDVLCICETFSQPATPDTVIADIEPPNYSVICASRSDGRRAGLAVIYRDRYRVNRVALTFAPKGFEVQTIALNVESERFIVVNIYRPPNYTNVDSFLDGLADVFDAVVDFDTTS